MVRGLVVLAFVLAAGCGRTPIYFDDDDVAVDWTHSYGVVRVRFRIAPNITYDPLVGTGRVVVELDYLDCILDFYASNPEWRSDGAEGAEIFDAAAGPDGLCGIGDTNGLSCDVVEIEESVEESFRLRVVYDVRGLTEGTQVLFGPLPKRELTQCESIVRVGRNEAFQGFDPAGALLWETLSFGPDKAAADQGQPIEISAIAP